MDKRRKLNPTKEELDYIIESFVNKTKSAEDLGREFGFSKLSIYRLLQNNHGIIEDYVNALFNESIKLKIKEMFLCGIDVNYIANTLNVTPSSVRYFLDINNIDFNSNIEMSSIDKRFYVYTHLNSEGKIVYIGSGTGDRYIRNTGRTKEHTKAMPSLVYKIVEYGLTKEESLKIEQDMLELHDFDSLFNIRKIVSKNKEIDYQTACTYLYYDESSPSCLRWKKGNYSGGHKRVKYGDVAGYLTPAGYWVVRVLGKLYQAHRLTYIIHNKTIKDNTVIDHINNNRSDNRIHNLRETSYSGNNKNKSKARNNTSGYTGVNWFEKEGCWRVYWHVNGKRLSKRLYVAKEYPNEHPEIAKQLTLELAIFTRKLLEEMHYGKDVL